MTYFTYDPAEMSLTEAYRRARPYLAADSVIDVSSTVCVGRMIDPRFGPHPLRDTYLVQVAPSGAVEILDSNMTRGKL